MAINTQLSRVESLINDLRTTDWERRIGAWAVTFLCLGAVWMFTDRAVETVKAVLLADEFMPGLEFNLFELLFEIPLEILPVTIGLGLLYLFALGIWRLGSRWLTIDSFRTRFSVLFGLGFAVSTALAFLLLGAAYAYALYAGIDPSPIVDEFVSMLSNTGTELVQWAIVSGVIALVASWRRDDVELTARRQQVLAVTVTAIILVPAALGAAGVAAPSSAYGSGEATKPIAAAMDDGDPGPDTERLQESSLSRGEFHAATQVLRCDATNESHFQRGDDWGKDYAVAAEYNISQPGTGEGHRLLLAPYRDAQGNIVEGRYAFRIPGVGEGWRVNAHWTINTEYTGESDYYSSQVGLEEPYGQDVLSNGTLEMENVTATTLVIDLVNPDGEIVRVRYRLCRPDVEV